MKSFWDSRYSEPQYAYGLEPNAFLASQLQKLKPGKLLLPMEGEGRNAVFAAKEGWKVDAFDYSEAAKHKAEKLATEAGVSFSYFIDDATHFQPAKGQYDAVAMIFAHLPPDIRSSFHRKLIDALRPGGVLLLEAFTPEQLNYQSGGPRQIEMLYTSQMLRQDFSELHIEHLEETGTVLDEGPFHSGKAAVIRLTAIKK
jgi:cyclopropane fatty-acyl-phospholipid synthase-like methyltransferase